MFQLQQNDLIEEGDYCWVNGSNYYHQEIPVFLVPEEYWGLTVRDAEQKARTLSPAVWQFFTTRAEVCRQLEPNEILQHGHTCRHQDYPGAGTKITHLFGLTVAKAQEKYPTFNFFATRFVSTEQKIFDKPFGLLKHLEEAYG